MDRVSLYLVATPIGNMGDMSARGAEVLSDVDFICAEDTRKSGILLKKFGIDKPMISYHDHNAVSRSAQIADRLEQGQCCALITDAGMPAISDPGELLVRTCHERGLRVSAVPGPCAAVTALALSGLSSVRFCFEGFLGSAPGERRARLEELRSEPRTAVIYEAPHRLRACLSDMLCLLGDRKIAVVREISKIYEQVLVCTVGEAVRYYEQETPRGEFVLVVQGAEKQLPSVDESVLKQEFYDAIKDGKTRTEASKIIAARYGMSKREIYGLFKDNSDEG